MARIGFLGPEGTFTHQAVTQQFGDKDIELIPQKSIPDCFKVIDDRLVDYAVVPFENSTNGQVVFTYDLIRDWFLPESGRLNPTFKIVGEQFVTVHHNLLTNAKSLNEIRTIYSHPQVWGQVSSFLSKKVDDSIKRLDTSSTAKGAEIVKNDVTNGSACIASHMSSVMFDLPVLCRNIEDVSSNMTRFLILGYTDLPQEKNDDYATSLIFTLPDNKPGALRKALEVFHKHEIDLTSINLRPSHNGNWNYVFFVELFGHINESRIQNSVEELKSYCQDVATLGSFKRISMCLD